jgi:16S rRNA pseudouridine516 synthase
MPSAKRHPRIDQLLASLGYGTRRDIDLWLKEGFVTVEGEAKPRSDMRIDPALIRFDGAELDHPEGLLILMNKPCGYVCSHDSREGPSVYDLLPERWRLRSPSVETIGRLDKDTSGLLLLTDRHELIHRLTSPKHHVAKVYEAEVEGELTPRMAEIFASGTFRLGGEDKPCLPARLDIVSSRVGRLTLNEGRYHQVRRMFGALGAPVLKLSRVEFGRLTLGELEESEYRLLRPELSSITESP